MNILETMEVVRPGLTLCSTIFIVLGICAFMIFMVGVLFRFEQLSIFAILIMFGCLLFATTIGSFIGSPTEKHYKMTISDNVYFQEFYAKYEIISIIDGEIYTVKEREVK